MKTTGWLRALGACCALGALAPLPAAAQGAAGLQGHVTSAAQAPLPGAQVRLSGAGGRRWQAVTDAAGRYALAGLAPGGYTLTVSALGHQPATRAVSLDVGARAVVDVALAPAPVALEALEVVSTTRTSVPVMAVPGAVSVIARAEVEAAAATSRGLGELLGKQVPGLAVGTQSMSNFGQSLRGRSVVVLIDGVPQSTLRNVSRDFANLDAAMVERVEVLRGATALYGDGATGGVINLITRRAGPGATRYTTELSSTLGLSPACRAALCSGFAPDRLGEGVSWKLTQGATGRRGALDFALSGTLEQTGRLYDAEGDLIPPDPHGQGGLAETRAYNLFAKTGLTRGAQRLQLGLTHYRSTQETGYTADPAVNQQPAGEAKARALAGVEQEIGQGTLNSIANLDYTHASLLGSRVHAQLYYRDYLTRFRPFDRRRFNSVGQRVSGQVSQSFVDSEKLGGRLEVESFAARGASLLWGADYTYENTAQPVYLMDEAAYDQSQGLVFRRVGERLWVPPLQPHSLGLFAQGALELGPLTLRGGVRRERVRMQVDDFVTLDEARVTGGRLRYDPLLFNAGAVLGVAQGVSAFASFSQGFSLADVGRILRAAKDGFDLGENRVEAQRVNHYEVGVRSAGRRLETSASLFYNTSELGTNFRLNEGMLEVVRAPERIRGVEGTLDVHPTRHLSLGGTLSWTEGEAYNEALQEYRALNGYRIQPLKLTGYGELRAGGWQHRVQALHSAARERAFRDRVDPAKPAGYGEQPIAAFTLLDYVGSVRLGPGSLRIGVENLLNRQYFDIVSQLDLTDGNAYYTAARGRALSLGYTVSY